MSRSHLKMQDALLYLDQVKHEFAENPCIYNQFLEIMKKFKLRKIETAVVIEKVTALFKGHTSLILGFNKFLPDGDEVNIPNEAVGGSSEISVTSGGDHHTDNFKPITEGNQSYAYSDKRDKRNQNHNHCFFTTVRNRFVNQPEIYRSFLKILDTYKREQYGYRCDMKSITDVFEQVAGVFRKHPDLLAEFAAFLPNVAAEQLLKPVLHSTAASAPSVSLADGSRSLMQKPESVIQSGLFFSAAPQGMASDPAPCPAPVSPPLPLVNFVVPPRLPTPALPPSAPSLTPTSLSALPRVPHTVSLPEIQCAKQHGLTELKSILKKAEEQLESVVDRLVGGRQVSNRPLVDRSTPCSTTHDAASAAHGLLQASSDGDISEPMCVELTYRTYVRRLPIPSDTKFSYQWLCQLARDSAACNPGQPVARFDADLVFTWTDEDGDCVHFSSDEELFEACRVMDSLHARCYKFCVLLTPRPGSLDEPLEPRACSVNSCLTANPTVLHVPHGCHECGVTSIMDCRFEYSARPTFNLCASCEQRLESGVLAPAENIKVDSLRGVAQEPLTIPTTGRSQQHTSDLSAQGLSDDTELSMGVDIEVSEIVALLRSATEMLGQLQQDRAKTAAECTLPSLPLTACSLAAIPTRRQAGDEEWLVVDRDDASLTSSLSYGSWSQVDSLAEVESIVGEDWTVLESTAALNSTSSTNLIDNKGNGEGDGDESADDDIVAQWLEMLPKVQQSLQVQREVSSGVLELLCKVVQSLQCMQTRGDGSKHQDNCFSVVNDSSHRSFATVATEKCANSSSSSSKSSSSSSSSSSDCFQDQLISRALPPQQRSRWLAGHLGAMESDVAISRDQRCSALGGSGSDPAQLHYCSHRANPWRTGGASPGVLDKLQLRVHAHDDRYENCGAANGDSRVSALSLPTLAGPSMCKGIVDPRALSTLSGPSTSKCVVDPRVCPLSLPTSMCKDIIDPYSGEILKPASLDVAGAFNGTKDHCEAPCTPQTTSLTAHSPYCTEDIPVAIITVPVPPLELESMPLSESMPVSVYNEHSSWVIELTLLQDMGFDNTGAMLELLRLHVAVPACLCTDEGRVANAQGFQRVIEILLAAQ